ncbi:MAG: ABC transporter ATP-binding protein [Spirochaetes bacterium]|nr:ABC transporter ATP-binding protein [Spirochaetota bacterium]
MADLKLENLSKRFSRKVWGVKKMDLSVKDKEFLVLLGPSGCGKTTTLRLIAGLEEATTGNILIDGVDITDTPPRKRDISMVFQSYAVWPHMTVYDNIAFALRFKHLSKAEIDSIVTETADMVKIDNLVKRYPDQLSGGQRQRVALARALAVKPKIFLMDEPLSNLDAKLRVVMRTELRAIHQQTKATTVFVTHDQSEAMSMADRIVIMKDGVIVQIGSPDDVYFKSTNVFVAGFIGMPPTNFFTVEIIHEGTDIVLKHPFFELKLDNERKSMLYDYSKRSLTFGIRPEDITITSEKNNLLKERALVVEPQGSLQIIALKIDDKIVKLVSAREHTVFPGDMLFLTFKQNKLHFFDIDTGERIGDL